MKVAVGSPRGTTLPPPCTNGIRCVVHRGLHSDSAISFRKLPEHGLYFSSGDGTRTLRSVAPLTSAIIDLISATGYPLEA